MISIDEIQLIFEERQRIMGELDAINNEYNDSDGLIFKSYVDGMCDLFSDLELYDKLKNKMEDLTTCYFSKTLLQKLQEVIK